MDEVYREIAKLLEAGGRGAVATVVAATGSTPGKEGAKMLVREDGSIAGTIGGGCVEADVWALAREALESERPTRRSFQLTPQAAEEEGLACGGTLEVFIEPIGAPSLFIFGAGHIALELEPLARRVGLRTVIVDDRESFASRKRFPEAHGVVVTPFEEALADLPVRPHSAIVIVTRGHRHDQQVLEQALRTTAGYIGLIGSRAKIGRIFRKLLDQGVPEDRLARVHAPIGLDIGARSPEEIAVSIVAELIAHRRAAWVKGDDPSRRGTRENLLARVRRASDRDRLAAGEETCQTDAPAAGNATTPRSADQASEDAPQAVPAD